MGRNAPKPIKETGLASLGPYKESRRLTVQTQDGRPQRTRVHNPTQLRSLTPKIHSIIIHHGSHSPKKLLDRTLSSFINILDRGNREKQISKDRQLQVNKSPMRKRSRALVNLKKINFWLGGEANSNWAKNSIFLYISRPELGVRMGRADIDPDRIGQALSQPKLELGIILIGPAHGLL